MKIYLVGGAVRDQLLNKTVHEKDYVVVGASVEDMLALGFRQVGKDFPVFLHPKTGEEYALARTERKSAAGYTGFQVFAAPEVSLEQDLLRRDLTINAIAQDTEGNLIDPYHGLEDIRQRVLRHVSPAFIEDPLRVLRVARFAARFAEDGFIVAAETLALLRQISASGELAYLAAERVWRETEKALATDSPHVYWQLLQAANALTPWFSELQSHLNLERLERQLASSTEHLSAQVHWALSCQDLTMEQLESLQQRLRVPKDFQLLCKIEHLVAYRPNQEIDGAWAFKAICQADGWRRAELMPTLIQLWRAVGMSQTDAAQFQRAWQAAAAIKANQAINQARQQGRELSGAEIGTAVRELQLQTMQQAWPSPTD